jgi:hypothetical protein
MMMMMMMMMTTSLTVRETLQLCKQSEGGNICRVQKYCSVKLCLPTTSCGRMEGLEG